MWTTICFLKVSLKAGLMKTFLENILSTSENSMNKFFNTAAPQLLEVEDFDDDPFNLIFRENQLILL